MGEQAALAPLRHARVRSFDRAEQLRLDGLARNVAASAGEAVTWFIPRTLVQTMLPYREPVLANYPHGYTRRYRGYSLILQPGSYTTLDVETLRDGRRIERPVTRSFGYPFGAMPRIILAYLSSEAKRRGSRQVYLGDSKKDFLHALGLSSTGGGKRGSGTQVVDALQRLLTVRIQSTSDSQTNQWRNINYSIADRADIDVLNEVVAGGTVRRRWRSTVMLSEQFYADVARSVVPVDMATLTALRRSPLAMDIYAFLTWVSSYINSEMVLSWQEVSQQFGTEARQAWSFKQTWLEAYDKVAAFYHPPIVVEERSLRILPGRPHVSRKPAAVAA